MVVEPNQAVWQLINKFGNLSALYYKTGTLTMPHRLSHAHTTQLQDTSSTQSSMTVSSLPILANHLRPSQKENALNALEMVCQLFFKHLKKADFYILFNLKKGCNRMGYFSSQSKDQGSLYLLTKSGIEANTCDSTVQFTLTSDKKSLGKKANGLFEVQLTSSTGAKSSTEVLDDKETTFESQSIVAKSVEFEQLPASGKITGAYVTYRRSYTSPFETRWSFKTIQVQQGANQSVTLCPVEKSGLANWSKTTQYQTC